MRRFHHCREPFYLSAVRTPHHADFSIAPGLSPKPFRQVIRVLRFNAGIASNHGAKRSAAASGIGECNHVSVLHNLGIIVNRVYSANGPASPVV